MTETRRTTLLTGILLVCLAALFPRMVTRGEVFSPADLLFSYAPWSYGSARLAPANITRSDEAVYHQPLMITHWKRLRAFEWPEWDPLLLGGAP